MVITRTVLGGELRFSGQPCSVPRLGPTDKLHTRGCSKSAGRCATNRRPPRIRRGQRQQGVDPLRRRQELADEIDIIKRLPGPPRNAPRPRSTTRTTPRLWPPGLPAPRQCPPEHCRRRRRLTQCGLVCVIRRDSSDEADRTGWGGQNWRGEARSVHVGVGHRCIERDRAAMAECSGPSGSRPSWWPAAGPARRARATRYEGFEVLVADLTTEADHWPSPSASRARTPRSTWWSTAPGSGRRERSTSSIPSGSTRVELNVGALTV